MNTDDPAQRKLKRLKERWTRQDQTRRDDAVKALMQHPQGRAYFHYLIYEETKAVGQTPFTGNALTTSFRCGEQNVGMKLMAHLMAVCPKEFLLMNQEAADERFNRDAELTSAVGGDSENGRDYSDGRDSD